MADWLNDKHHGMPAVHTERCIPGMFFSLILPEFLFFKYWINMLGENSQNSIISQLKSSFAKDSVNFGTIFGT